MEVYRDIKFLILVVIIGFSPFITGFNNYDEIKPNSGFNLRIANYNLHYGVTAQGEYDLKGLMDLIEKEKPHIIGFQEITFYSPFNGFSNMFNEMVSLMSSLGFNYYYYSQGFNYNLGNAIFSVYKITNSKTYEFDAQNVFQRSLLEVEINVNGNSLYVYVTHLTHIPGGGKSGEVRISQVSEIIERMDLLNFENTNFVLMGDFNTKILVDDVITPEMALLLGLLNSTWSITNPDEDGFTSPASDPSKKIDFILVNDLFVTPTSCNIVLTIQSDHLPQFCDITIS